MFSSYEEQKNFEIWAFGASPITYNITTMHAWNSHHGDEFYANPHDDIGDDLDTMFFLYKDYLKAKDSEDEDGAKGNR